MKNRLLSTVAAVALMFGVATAPASAAEVKIGVALGVTGTFAFVGVPVVNAIKLALKDLGNKAGPHTLNVIFEDNRSDKQEAISLLTRMANSDGIQLFIGPISTGEAMATAPVANDLKVPMFTTATSPAVLQSGPWVFKYPENAESYMGTLGKYVAEKVKPKSCFIVFIRDNEGYIRQSDIFRDTIKAGGVGIAAEESILAADTDFTALSSKIADSGADCLFMSTPPAQGANIVIQARQAGMSADVKLVGNTGMSSDRYSKAGGEAVEGTYIPAEFVPSGVNDFAKQFIANYTKDYGVAPDGFAAGGYSMMMIAADAISRAGDNPTRQSIRDALAATKDAKVVLGSGSFSFDENRVPHFGMGVVVLRNGKYDAP